MSVSSHEKPKCYLVCGISGSGKTTFAKKYARDNGLRDFSPEDFYQITNGDAAIHTHSFDVWLMMLRAIHIAEQTGRSCVVDTNALTKVERSEFLLWFPDFEFHMIYISAPREVYRQNNLNRARCIPEDVIQRMEAALEPPADGEDSRWNTIVRYRNTGSQFEVF